MGRGKKSSRGGKVRTPAAPVPHPPPPPQQGVPILPVENTNMENTTAPFLELVWASIEAKRGGRDSEAAILACSLQELYPSSRLASDIFVSAAASALIAEPSSYHDRGFMVHRVCRAFWYFHHANERARDPAQIDSATTRWNGMTEEQRAGFLSLKLEEIQAFLYRQNSNIYEPWPERLLSDAVSFAKMFGSWVYWSCPVCPGIFTSEESFVAHVESEHLLQMPTELNPLVYVRVPCEDSELKSSGIMIKLDPDASCLLLGVKKGDSLAAEELFNCLFVFGFQLSGILVKEGNHHERTHYLEELNLLIELLGICRLNEISKCDISPYGENLLDEVGLLDSKRLVLKIQCLKKNLAESSKMDFGLAVMPIIKSYLWAKLMGKDTETVSRSTAMSNTEKLSELKIKIECLKRALPDRNKVTKDRQWVFWRVIVRSLWYLRRFREKILVTIAGCRHIIYAEGSCILCMLYKIFDAWDKKEDDKIALLFPKMETALKSTLTSNGKFEKLDGSSAYEVIARIFEILHFSQTLSFCYTIPTLDIQVTETKTSICVGNTCIVHNLFGLCNDHEMRSVPLDEMTHHHQYSSFFHILQADSFIDLRNVMDQLSISDIGSVRANCVDHFLSQLPHFFTAVVIWPDGIIDNCTAISKILVSMASPFDIGLLFKRNQPSDNKYALASMVCECNHSHLMFARCGDDSKKWLVYNGKTCEESSELVELLVRYADRTLLPEVLFLECTN